jgi:hypothetical protein
MSDSATIPADTATEPMVNPLAVFCQRNSTTPALLRVDLLKCNHVTGEWTRARGESATPIKADDQFLVNPQELIDTWTKFVGGQFVERRVYRAAHFEFAPERAELGDLDETKWDWSGNKRRDPWLRAGYIPMKVVGDNETLAFRATGAGAIGEVGELVGMYASTARDGKVPVVRLASRSYESTHGNLIYVPVFKLLSWAFWEADTPLPPLPLRAASAVSLPAKVTKAAIAKLVELPQPADIDDKIPF